MSGRAQYGRAWFKVSGEMRGCPIVWWLAMLKPVPGVPDEFTSKDGCSCSPDYLLGREVWLACFVHDWEYSVAGTLGTRASRRAADLRLRQNLLWLLREQGMGWFRRRRWAWTYWGRVRVWGASSYNWGLGEKPYSKWALLREAWLPW